MNLLGLWSIYITQQTREISENIKHEKKNTFNTDSILALPPFFYHSLQKAAVVSVPLRLALLGARRTEGPRAHGFRCGSRAGLLSCLSLMKQQLCPPPRNTVNDNCLIGTVNCTWKKKKRSLLVSIKLWWQLHSCFLLRTKITTKCMKSLSPWKSQR